MGLIHILLLGSAYSSGVHRSLSDSDLVVHGRFDRAGSFDALILPGFDLWRVEDGKIVEHWDVVSPTPEQMAHGNGKF